MNSGLLVSFCNTPPYSRLRKRGYSSLGFLDYKKKSIYWLKLAVRGITYSGITGLAADKKRVFALYQAQTPALLFLEKWD